MTDRGGIEIVIEEGRHRQSIGRGTVVSRMVVAMVDLLLAGEGRSRMSCCPLLLLVLLLLPLPLLLVLNIRRETGVIVIQDIHETHHPRSVIAVERKANVPDEEIAAVVGMTMVVIPPKAERIRGAMVEVNPRVERRIIVIKVVTRTGILQRMKELMRTRVMQMKVVANPVRPLMVARRREVVIEEMTQVTVIVQMIEAIAANNVLIIIMPLEISAIPTTNNIVILWTIGVVTGLMDVGIYLTKVDIHQKFTLEVLITVVVLVLYLVVVVLVLLTLLTDHQGLKVTETIVIADITKEIIAMVVVLGIIINMVVEEVEEGNTSTIGMVMMIIDTILKEWTVGVVVIDVIGVDFVFGCE